MRLIRLWLATTLMYLSRRAAIALVPELAAEERRLESGLLPRR